MTGIARISVSMVPMGWSRHPNAAAISSGVSSFAIAIDTGSPCLTISTNSRSSGSSPTLQNTSGSRVWMMAVSAATLRLVLARRAQRSVSGVLIPA